MVEHYCPKTLSDKFDFIFNELNSSDSIFKDKTFKIDSNVFNIESDDFFAVLDYDNILFSNNEPTFLLDYNANNKLQFIDFILPKFKIRKVDFDIELNKLIYIYKRNKSHAQFMFQEILFNTNPRKINLIMSFIRTNHICAEFFIKCLMTYYNKLKYMQDYHIYKYNTHHISNIILSLEIFGLHDIYKIYNN